MSIHCVESTGKLEKISDIYLMSQSPRRRQLLQFLSPVISGVEIDERSVQNEASVRYAKHASPERFGLVSCALAKAKCGTEREEGTLYIGADTMVILDGKVFNKPLDEKEAYAMLRSYFGKSHHVVTGVCLAQNRACQTFYSVTEVTFVPYSSALEDAIKAYVQSGKPLDKAGGYGIQEIPPYFVQEICGDYYTVMGLPVAEIGRRILGNMV